MSIEKINISKNIKKLRSYKNITLIKLSEDLNQKYNATKQYELEKSIPPINILIIMAKYFNISIDYLLLWDETKYIKNTKLLILANKIDKMTSNERYRIESTIETLLPKQKEILKSNFDNFDITLTNNIHENIKILRENNNLSQRELCKQLSFSSSVISQYENKNNIPTPENLIKLSTFFNISIHAIITGKKLSYDFRNDAFKETVLNADSQLTLEHHKFLMELMDNIINY